LASFSDDADYGFDVSSEPSKYPDDGSDYCGATSGVQLRVPNKFTISTLPATDTVDQVDFDIYVSSVTGAGSSSWILGPYNGDGQANPQSDSASNAFSRSNVSSDNYLTGITAFRTTGQKSFTDLGAQANTDVENARDAGTIFSLAIRMTSESGNNYCQFRIIF